MKTNILTKWTVAVVSSLLMVGTVACNSGGGGSSSAATTNPYYMSNGQCYATGGQVTALSNCNNLANNGYSLVNGQCVYTSTNQVVAAQNCNMGSVTSGITNYPTGVYPTSGMSGVTMGQCYGIFYYVVYGYGYFQPVQCMITNCSGYTLINGYGQYQYCM